MRACYASTAPQNLCALLQPLTEALGVVKEMRDIHVMTIGFGSLPFYFLPDRLVTPEIASAIIFLLFSGLIYLVARFMFRRDYGRNPLYRRLLNFYWLAFSGMMAFFLGLVAIVRSDEIDNLKSVSFSLAVGLFILSGVISFIGTKGRENHN